MRRAGAAWVGWGKPVGDGLTGRQRGQWAAFVRWGRVPRPQEVAEIERVPYSRARSRLRSLVRAERVRVGGRSPYIGRPSFAEKARVNVALYPTGPVPFRDVPRGCRGCEEPVEKPGEWCGACRVRR